MEEIRMAPEAAPPMKDEDILNYTQGLRKRLVDEVVKDGIPTTKEDKTLLLTALSEMDKTALGKMRIAVEDKANKNSEEAKELIAKILKMSPGRNREIIDVTREIPMLDQTIPEPEAVPGELDQSPEPLDYNSFMERFD